MNFKEIYSEKINGVSLNEGFYENTLEIIRQTSQRKESLFMKRKPIKVFAAAIAIVALFSVSVYAIGTMLSAKEVAEITGNDYIASAFEDSDFVPQTISDDTYSVTLHGIASGSKLVNIDGVDVKENRSYIVVSMAKTDGTKLSVTGSMPVQVSPLVGGFEVWRVNAWSLGASVHGIEHEGVLYYLFDTADIEIFADNTVYIAAYEGYIPTNDIFVLMDDGTITFNESYEGFKALFTLELDKSKADAQAVEEFMAIWNE